MTTVPRKAISNVSNRPGLKSSIICENSKSFPITVKMEDDKPGNVRQTRAAVKRKADSTVENKPKKRTAFGDLTNAIGKSTRGLTAKVAKKSDSKGKETSSVITANVATNKRVEASSSVAVKTEFKQIKTEVADVKVKTEVKQEVKEGSVAESSLYTTPSQEPSWAETESGPPPGVDDFDKENLRDPFCVAEYATDIFINMKKREEKFKVKPYLEHQTDLSRSMRVILVDWMVEVQESFELNHETLYTAVKMVDLFLSKVHVQRDNLQLVGATATLIAAKFEERCPPAIDDFLYICDDAYSRRELLRMEINMIKEVGFDIGFPLSYSFLRRYARCAKLNMETLTLARYILESSLMEYDLITESESQMAAGSLLLALRMKNMSGWTPCLEYYSGFKLEDIQAIASRLLDMLKQPTKENIKTIRGKYSHQIFFEVALTPVPLTLNL